MRLTDGARLVLIGALLGVAVVLCAFGLLTEAMAP